MFNFHNQRFKSIADELERQGLHEQVNELVEIDKLYADVSRPAGIFSSLTTKVTQKAQAQWENVLVELQESRTAWEIIRKCAQGSYVPTPQERQEVRAQLLDILKLVPAFSIAILNAALPVPGTSALTPWLLMKMGLFPSRWQELHILHRLEKQIAHLESRHKHTAAKSFHGIIREIDALHDRQSNVSSTCALLTHWDLNCNGKLDEDEIILYNEAVEKIAAIYTKSGHRKSWYILYNQHIFGPVFLHELHSRQPNLELLVAFKDKTPWVRLDDLMASI